VVTETVEGKEKTRSFRALVKGMWGSLTCYRGDKKKKGASSIMLEGLLGRKEEHLPRPLMVSEGGPEAI